jgi:hypothetical protein
MGYYAYESIIRNSTEKVVVIKAKRPTKMLNLILADIQN